MLRAWLAMICLCSVIGAGRQQDGAAAVKDPSSSPLELVPGEIDFGTQPVAATSPPKTATVVNRSSQTVTIRDVTASGIDFSESDNCHGRLAAGARCTITVTFTPASTGSRLGTVLIATDFPRSLFLVLAGTGE